MTRIGQAVREVESRIGVLCTSCRQNETFRITGNFALGVYPKLYQPFSSHVGHCPIKGNVKKNLPSPNADIFLGIQHPFERHSYFREVSCSGLRSKLRFRVRSGETLLPVVPFLLP